jgi:hypothetical protein
MPAGPIDDAALARDYRKIVPADGRRAFRDLWKETKKSVAISSFREDVDPGDGLRRRGSFYIEAIKWRCERSMQ